MAKTYKIKNEISIEGLANKKNADLSLSEIKRGGYRVIGGDKGDLRFYGYVLNEERNVTILYKPELLTTLELTGEEAAEIAQEILNFSFESIGFETVEHS